MLLLLLTACSPFQGIDDAWSVTMAACEPAQPFVRDYVESTPVPISAACEAALVADFGVPEVMEPVELREWVLEATLNLLARDMGQVDELEVNEWVRQPFIDTMGELSRRSGHTDVGRLVYNYTAQNIDAIEGSTTSIVGFRYIEDEKLVRINHGANLNNPNVDIDGVGWSLALFHEATHAFTEGHIKCSPASDGRHCDEGWEGSYGHHFAAAWLMEQSCELEWDYFSCVDLRHEYEFNRSHIIGD